MKETFVIEEKKKKTSSLPNPAHLLKSHLLKEKQTLVEGNVRIEIKK